MERDFKAVGEFVIPFSKAIVKLKNAVNAGLGVTLTAEETKATIEALRLLRSGQGEA